MKNDRWPGERSDAEGRDWKLRNGSWLVWSRIKMRYPSRSGRSSLPMWSGAALMLIYAAFVVGSAAATLFALVKGLIVWPALMNVALWGGLGSILLWRMYLPSRRYVLFQQRVRDGVCPSCAQPLLHDERVGGDAHRRCAECGHLWKWPPARMEEPDMGW